VWMDPYTKGQDQLSVLKNDYDNVISGNFSVESGVLELIKKGGRELTKNDWNTVLNYPSYRLFINVSPLCNNSGYYLRMLHTLHSGFSN